MKIAVYDIKGIKTEGTISTKIFDGEKNDKLVAEALYIARSNTRQATAKTKDKSEVSGGGRKPWRQKGTGRARVGSSRSPIWRGGGVTFGPTGEQNFTLAIPKKKKRMAFMSALATKDATDILVVNQLKLEKPSTKKISEMLEKLDLTRNVLMVVENMEENITKSASNIQSLILKDYKNVNLTDILWAKKILFLGNSLDLLGKNLEAK